MNISFLHTCPHFARSSGIRATKWLSGAFASRHYATHRDPTIASSPLSQSLDTGRRSTPRLESVGPFQLGVSPNRDQPAKKWSELSAGGKVIRTGARTTNLTVILLGAGFSALLVYSLTTELFSKNSPTVLYGDACKRITASPQVARYMNGPFTFHNNPPSAIRPRHRNRHVSSQIMVDSTGREHMIMNFYMQGKPPGSQPTSDESYFESISTWSKEALESFSKMTTDDGIVWVKDTAADISERAKRLFKYLSGSPMPPPPLPTPSLSPEGKDMSRRPDSGAWSLAGMFSSLKGAKSGYSEAATSEPDGRIWTEGEVHADLIKNNDGYFVFRYLLVDIPKSRSRDSVRVFVERAPTVRMDEPVIRWNS
ncbi:hypothetical protein BDN71DRAFT_1443766 [Pleurotus eryngii]|uniref:Mitochondrial import inner membrane translocase subunit Tim21 n=1 Tax=Pleurotus eryngii TaxID=5323 RepID=A0A9P6A1B3_PLEER|nr:hypothetical protein BDN71DRAFT_1443766 [Pleurotus eryngii]